MLTFEQLAFLISDRGTQILRETSLLPSDTLKRLTSLRKNWSAEQAAATVSLLDLRTRARDKFSRADEMFFTAEGLEQSTSESVAAWRAKRFQGIRTIADLTCGIGGDSVALAQTSSVTAVDLQPEMTLCAAANARAYAVENKIEVICGDCTQLQPLVEAALIDPGRRVEGRRVRNVESWSPPLSFIFELSRRIPNLAVKISPATPNTVIEQLGGRVEFVSHNHECKEAVIWFGEIGPKASVTATILPEGLQLISQGAPLCVVAECGEWLLEPNPAVIRASLVPELAAIVNARALNTKLTWLTADTNPCDSALRPYKVLSVERYNLKELSAKMRRENWFAKIVKTRGVSLTPEEILPQLPKQGEREVVIIVAICISKLMAIVCLPLSKSNLG